MKYKICRLSFPGGVHLGNRQLEDTSSFFSADTLFSALCIEAIGEGKEIIDRLLEYVKGDQLLISDALPYIGDSLYVPKPICKVEQVSADPSGADRKVFKKLSYIAIEELKAYMSGEYPKEKAGVLDGLGHKRIRTLAAVRGCEETVPYRVGEYFFNNDCGLYIVAAYEDESAIALFEKLMTAVSYDGIGGRRSSGLGRFSSTYSEPDKLFSDALNASEGTLMTLSVSLPLDSEIEKAMEGAHYLLFKRSGFVYEREEKGEPVRKRDMYVMQAGSTFTHAYKGDVYDVSNGGLHPVYRYAKPMFMGIK